MTQSKSRQQAEIAFDRVQSQFFARGQAVEELQTEEQTRQAKTQRLREARLARDEQRIKLAELASFTVAGTWGIQMHGSVRSMIQFHDVASCRVAGIPAMVTDSRGPIHVRREAITICSRSNR